MDKRVIFAVAGSGKTTYIVNNLFPEKRSLIITYTKNNYSNIESKVLKKFNGTWPQNILLMTYFQFLFRFCYKPFLADKFKGKGIVFKSNPNKWEKQSSLKYYFTGNRYFYSNRLAFFLENQNIINDIKKRLEKYFDEFIIDEVQDIAGRDFNFLEKLMDAEINMLFVGDFFQHTFDTSRDGNVNKSLFNNKLSYEERFQKRGFFCDSTTLVKSWRCSYEVCDFITNNLGITIFSNHDKNDNNCIALITDEWKIKEILENDNIIKLHYQDSNKYGNFHKNWGDSKGEDNYQDVCVMLNKKTMSKFKSGKLYELPSATLNKLYVAITRAHRNCYFIEEYGI